MVRKKRFSNKDNAPSHTAKSTMEWLEEKGVTFLELPAQSPDLNPIANLRAIMDKKRENRKCKSKNALRNRVEKEWGALHAELLQKLITSMPKRCAAVIKQKGGSTKY